MSGKAVTHPAQHLTSSSKPRDISSIIWTGRVPQGKNGASKHIKNLPKSFLYSENRRFPDGKRALFLAVCVCNLASQKHLGSAQLTDSCPLEFFLEKISEPTEWEKALGSNILKKYFKDWATVGSCSEPETGQISAVNMALWAKEDVLHTSHHQSLSSAFPALLCLPKGTIWSV